REKPRQGQAGEAAAGLPEELAAGAAAELGHGRCLWSRRASCQLATSDRQAGSLPYGGQSRYMTSLLFRASRQYAASAAGPSSLLSARSRPTKATSFCTSPAAGARPVVRRIARRTCAARSPGASRRRRSARALAWPLV